MLEGSGRMGTFLKRSGGLVFGVLLTVMIGVAPYASGQASGPRRARSVQEKPEENQAELDAEALEEFREEVEEYIELRKKLESKLPPLPRQAAPAKVHSYEIELEKLIARARARSQEGDIFVSEIRPLIRRLCRSVLTTAEGKALLAEIREEAEERISVPARINTRYPDEIPISTVPYDLLKVLPPLPDVLEYRFLGRHLILLDIDARIIVDVIRNVIPH